MGGKPMKIPWPEVLAGGRDARGGVESQEERTAVTSICDRELRETIERMKSRISSVASRLPDKGAKFRTRLRELEEEQERRKRPVQVEDKDLECDRATKSKRVLTSDSGKSFCSPTLSQSILQSSFTSLNHKLDAKADTGVFTIDAEKLLSAVQDSKSSKGEHNTRSPLRSSPSLSSVANGAKRKSSGCNHKDVASSSYSVLNDWEYNSSPISRRTRARKRCEPQELDWIKHEDVVLLDDEDVLPVRHAEERPEDGEMKEAKIYYPSRDHPEFVEVCYADMKCLDPKSYLSSTIMNFYIQYLQKPTSIIGRSINEYHFFNTYFYQKLEKAVSCKVDKNANFSKLRRWLRGVNIFQKAYIFLPIHGDLHWSLVIICIPAKEAMSGPIILHLDSLGFHSSNAIFGNIEIYLKEEWKHVYTNTSPTDTPISKEIWDSLSHRINRKKIMVPQQKNEYDCGLFVLYFMERFIEEAPERVKSKDHAKFGSKWFQPEEASGLRKQLRELLLHEFNSARLENHKEKSPEKFASSQEYDVQHGDNL